MQIVIDITESEASRVHNALCVAGGQPVADTEGAKLTVINWIKQTVENVNHSEAQREGVTITVPPVEGLS